MDDRLKGIFARRSNRRNTDEPLDEADLIA